jgi:hypothetical protein
MIGLIFVLIAIVMIIGIIITMMVWKKEGLYEKPNYQTFFILGITFLPMGLVFIFVIGPPFIVFTVMGLSYLTIGLLNKDKWRKEE